MSKKAKQMKARRLEISVIDLSLIYSIWSKRPMKRQEVRTSVEIQDAIEPVLEEHGDILGKASEQPQSQEHLEKIAEAKQALQDSSEEIILSPAAFDDLEKAFKEHTGWTNRGARQVLRMHEVFRDAEWIDVGPDQDEEEEAPDPDWEREPREE